MIKLVEMDENVKLISQLEEEGNEDGGRSVILINKFNVKPEDVPELLTAWAAEARFHFYTASSRYWRKLRVCLVNYTVWESVEHFKHASRDPTFKSTLACYPASTVTSPHLFRKVAVPRICVD